MNLIGEALEAGAEIDAGGEVYLAEEVHEWLEKRARGEEAPELLPASAWHPPRTGWQISKIGVPRCSSSEPRLDQRNSVLILVEMVAGARSEPVG